MTRKNNKKCIFAILNNHIMHSRFYKLISLLILVGCFTNIYAHHRDTLGNAHLEFIENKGQWDSKVIFKTAFTGHSIFLERDGITYATMSQGQLNEFFHCKSSPNEPCNSNGIIDAAAYKVQFMNANPEVRIMGRDVTYDYVNYFIGNDPAHWTNNVHKFHEVFYDEIYRGIDMVIYQKDYLKYEFRVDPGVSPKQIVMRYDGVNSLSITRENLFINTSVAQTIELKPVAYQINAKGDTTFIPCRYKLNKNKVSFEMGEYDNSRELVIDPILIFSSFSGSTADNWGYSATYDNYGNLYSGGNAFNMGYPTSVGAYQIDYAGGSCDMAISKFSSDGSQLLYSTYIGGKGTEVPHSLIVSETNELYILGTSGSSDYPTLENAYQRTFKGGTAYALTGSLHYAGSDIVISKLNSDGTILLGSTYVGGSGNDGLNTPTELNVNYADEVRGEILLDNNNNVYVASCTQSKDFPVTNNAFQKTYGGSTQDGCVFKMNNNLTSMVWSSFLGGNYNDAVYSIVLGNDQSLYVCGGTNSANFPTTAGAVQRNFARGKADGFITRISNDGTRIINSTFLGSSDYDQTYLIKNDSKGFPYVFGQTSAMDDFWIKNVKWYVLNGGQFLTKLSLDLDEIIWSTAFGTGIGGPDISPSALLIDLCQNIYMSGWGGTSVNSFGGTAGLPITRDAFQKTTDNNDYYFICLNDDVSQLVYATYFGSNRAGEHVDGGTSRFDKKGKIYQAVCAGCGAVQDFPTTPGAWSQRNRSSNCNIGVIKFDFDLPAVVADFLMPNTICAPLNLQFENTSQSISEENTEYIWDFGDGSSSNEKNPTHLYDKSGTYDVTLIVNDLTSCNFGDTITKTLVVLSNSYEKLPTLGYCKNGVIQIGIQPSGNSKIQYRWQPTTGLDDPTIANPHATPSVTTTYKLFITDGTCVDTMEQTILVEDVQIEMPEGLRICDGSSILIEPTVTGGDCKFYWSTSSNMNPIINSDTNTSSLLVSPHSRTKYYFQAIGEYCKNIAEVEVDVILFSIDKPKLYTLCEGKSIQIGVTVTPADEFCQYEWEPAEYIVAGASSSTPTVAPRSDTRFTVIATNSMGCKDTAEVEVIVHNLDSIIVDAQCDPHEVYRGESVLLSTPEINGYHYYWTPSQFVEHPDSASTHATPTQNICFTVTVTDPNGCTKQDTTCLKVKEVYCEEPYIFIPNAFTPNGDGKNDILYVRGDEYLVSFVLKIYDRWGEKVFESQDVNQGWDGTFRGQICQPGVYDYFLDATCLGKNRLVKKGNITLIR